MARILLVDDDPQALEPVRKILALSGHAVVTAGDGQEALEKARPSSGEKFDLILTDVRMPRLGGMEFLRALSLCGDTTPIVLMTAFGRVEDAVWAMKLGAVDFLTKPFKKHALLSAVEAALKRKRAGGAVPPPAPGEHDSIVGSSQAMRELRAAIAQIAPTAAPVLLTGESGTGKELVARSIHRQSARSQGPFVAINCAALPEQLIESELFGHEKGAFTGATAAKPGLFEAAHGGTLLLDEIGDMPLSLQAKLLRVLQEGEVRRLGSTVPRKVEVRIVSASHRDIREAAKQGTFRQDLLFRLEVIGLRVPALRERGEDILELARHYLARFSGRHGKTVESLAPEVRDALMSHAWPGNVRELSNVIERAVVFANGAQVELTDLPAHLAAGLSDGAAAAAGKTSTIEVPLGTPLREVEDLLIRKTLEATEGDKNMTAKLLGINSRTIYRKLEKER